MMVADSTRELHAPDAARAIGTIWGVEEGSNSIDPFYPDNFIIHCCSRETHDTILAASPVPAAETLLVLRPWTRLAQASATAFKFKVTIDLEGVAVHVWSEDTVAKAQHTPAKCNTLGVTALTTRQSIS
jgi:hypothetical protein